MKNVIKGSVLFVVGLVSSVMAQAATVPTGTEITAGITAAGAAAGGAGVLGLSIWVYRKIKAKSGQALG